MRSLACLAIVLGCGAATGVLAQPAPSPGGAAALLQAAFASGSQSNSPGPAQLLGEQVVAHSQSPSSYRFGAARIPGSGGGAVDTLQFGSAQSLIAPSGLPLAPGQTPVVQAYEVSVERVWPRALAFETRSFGVDFSPHAGVGVNSFGGVAEAGGRVEVSQRLDNVAKDRLRALGVRDGAAFGTQGRWYLFAAASGRAVGLNMLRGDSGWNRAGWTTDPTSTLVGDAQVGVGWRKGAMQTSLGFVHQELKNDHLLYGQESRSDSMVALSFSIRPTAH